MHSCFIVIIAIMMGATGCGLCPTPKPQPAPRPPECPPTPIPLEPQCPDCPGCEPKFIRSKCPPCVSGKDLGVHIEETAGPTELAQKTSRQTCVFGQALTAGDITLVIQRAEVTVSTGAGKSMGTWTDAQGLFAMCLDSQELGVGDQISITVAKPPFTPVTQMALFVPGQHIELKLHLEAEGLTSTP